MNWRERIASDPDVLMEKPVIEGTRLSVKNVLELLENGWSEADILDRDPLLDPEDVRACLGDACEVLAAPS